MSDETERMLSAHDLALRCQRDRLVRALLDHACDCGPMDPDLAEHRETCPFRQALEAVEGGGVEEKYETFGESNNLLDDPIWQRVEVGDRVVEFQVPAGASIPFRIPAASDSEDQGTGDGYGEHEWREVKAHRREPFVMGLCRCGETEVWHESEVAPDCPATPQDADAEAEQEMWVPDEALAKQLEIFAQQEDEPYAKRLREAARRLRRGGGEGGSGNGSGGDIGPDPNIPATEPEFVERGGEGGSETKQSGDGDD